MHTLYKWLRKRRIVLNDAGGREKISGGCCAVVMRNIGSKPRKIRQSKRPFRFMLVPYQARTIATHWVAFSGEKVVVRDA